MHFVARVVLIPLIYSLKSRDSYYLGDYSGAIKRSNQAKNWNIISFIVSIILGAVIIIFRYVMPFYSISRHESKILYNYSRLNKNVFK